MGPRVVVLKDTLLFVRGDKARQGRPCGMSISMPPTSPQVIIPDSLRVKACPDGRPLFSLYSVKQITIAALMFGPLAGTWLMWRNYVALGQRSAGNKVLTLGAVAALIVAAGGAMMYSTSDPKGATAIGLLLGIIMVGFAIVIRLAAKSGLGGAIDVHVGQGGEQRSDLQLLCESLVASAITFGPALAIFS